MKKMAEKTGGGRKGKRAAPEQRLSVMQPGGGAMEFVMCRDDTGRSIVRAGNPFSMRKPHDVAIRNQNSLKSSYYLRPATPLDHIHYEMNHVLRTKLLSEPSAMRLVKVAFRGSGNEKFDGASGYALKVSSKTDALFDDAGHLLGDDIKGWSKVPAKLQHDEGENVTEAFRNPPVERYGVDQKALALAG
jgi:hypothetical protein